jgi:DNA-binding LacI/PurR family transcriptional regulator
MNEIAELAANGTVYEALVGRLRQSIVNGEFKVGQLIGTEYGISRDEKISRMTVRRASEILVNEGLIERRPGKGLYIRAIAGRKVQIVAGNLVWESSSRISRGAQEVGQRDGCQIQIYDAHGSIEADLEMMRDLPVSGARGAIILSLHSSAFTEILYKLKVERFPFVLVDQRLAEIPIPSVTADNESGGYQVGQMLLKAGHRRIAFIGDLEATTTRDRLSGLRDAISDANLAFNRSLVLDLLEEKERMSDWSGRVDQCTRELMNLPVPPTAIFCSCDAVARGVYRSLGQLGLCVPGDVSVVGFDDDPLAEWLTPGLTTVRQPFSEMGQAAMEMLSTLMDDPGAQVESRILPVEIVLRGSVAAPKAPHEISKKGR